jgi:hypothetical protein
MSDPVYLSAEYRTKLEIVVRDDHHQYTAAFKVALHQALMRIDFLEFTLANTLKDLDSIKAEVQAQIEKIKAKKSL